MQAAVVATDDVRLAGLVRRYQVPNERLDFLVPLCTLASSTATGIQEGTIISMGTTERFLNHPKPEKSVRCKI